MNAVVPRLLSTIHSLPWMLARTCVRFAVSSTIAGLIIWHAYGADHQGIVYAALAVLMIMAVVPRTPNSVLSIHHSLKLDVLELLATIKSAYRRTAVRLTWVSTMQRAKLYETVHIEESLHSLRSTPGGRKVPRLKRWGRARIRYTPCGLVLTVDGSRIGAGVDAFEGEQALVLKSKWRALDIAVAPSARLPYLTELRVIFTDPFADIIRPSQLPAPPLPPTGVCTIGKDSDGRWVAKDARRASLIAGSPGAGKSSECWALLHELVRQQLPFRVRVYDPKGGQEFFDLADKAYRYEANPTAWCAFLEEALAAMAAQQASLKAAGHRKWTPQVSKLAPLTIGEQWPLDVMIIDELVTVIAMMAGAENKVTINGKKVPALKAFLVYLSQCRAAGFTVIACTQLTQKEAIGLIRDLFAYVTCLRVGSDEMVKTILGNPKTYPAHQIPVGDAYAGIGYMQDLKTGQPIKYRAFYLEDDERAEVANQIEWWSRKYWSEVKHTKGGPITLDLGDDELDVSEVEQAALDELVHICQKCRTEFIPEGELAMHGSAA
jgi:hypothetical protein